MTFNMKEYDVYLVNNDIPSHLVALRELCFYDFSISSERGIEVYRKFKDENCPHYFKGIYVFAVPKKKISFRYRDTQSDRTPYTIVYIGNEQKCIETNYLDCIYFENLIKLSN